MKLLSIFIILSFLAYAQTYDLSRWMAPAAAAAMQNPLKDRTELANGGKKVFQKLCASCHVSGTVQKERNLADQAVQQESDGALFWKISTGNTRSGMPGYGSLPDTQRWQLVLYIRSLDHRPQN
jgi:mono/diheme cytochrome c family protein